MLHSSFRPLTAVVLPFAMRQMYMHSFDLSDPKMPPGFEDYEQPVRDLCNAAGARAVIEAYKRGELDYD
jgi:hypothetical protein